MISNTTKSIIQNITAEKYDTYLARDYIQSETDIDILGYGIDRIVIKEPTTNYAVKISCTAGHPQNTAEYEIYNQVTSEMQERLLPIISTSSDNKYIVTPLVEDTYDTPIGEHFCGPNAEQIANMLSEEGFKLIEIETAHYNNKIVAIDYGHLE